MRYLSIKNWTEFQHYKDRNPPWIKLHRALLDDYEFSRLQDASKAHLILIWLLASQNDGRVPDDPKFLQRKLSLERPPDLKSFIDQGLLIAEQVASTVIAESKQSAMPRREEERREEEREFASFWQAYPRKAAKPSALKAWNRLLLQNGDCERLMAALDRFKESDSWRQDDGKYIPYPATWLNHRRFDDGVAEPKERKVSLE